MNRKTKDTKTQKIKTQKDENWVLPKELAANADLFKPVLNKLMTTCKTHGKEELKNSRVKFNVAPPPIQNILSAQLSLVKY